MDQKLKSLQRNRDFLRIHRFICYIAAVLIVALCVNGLLKKHWSMEQVVSVAILGIGCCIFSALTGMKQANSIDRAIERLKSEQDVDQKIS